MSNVGRPRTGLKKCTHCGSTKRDSNGQCNCRNTLYRALRGVAKTTAEKAAKHYNVALKNKKGDPQAALAITREAYPALQPKRAAKKAAPAKKAVAKKTAKKAASKKAETVAVTPKKAPRYTAVLSDGETKTVARKDAAINWAVKQANGSQTWQVKVEGSGKVVAVSDDLL